MLDSVTDDVRDGEAYKVDAEASLEDAGSFSVAFFPRIGFLPPFVEEFHDGCNFKVSYRIRLQW